MDSTTIMKSTTRLIILFSALMASFTGDGGGSSGVARGQEDWMQCPLICKCKWVSGKKTAECIKQNLTEIPKSLSSEIQNLDLNGNRITSVQQHAFSEVKLVNLHKLVLRDCGIETIHIGAFHGLKIVIEIDLSGNNIKTLVPGTFDETQRLRVLLLNQNRLRFLEAGLFHDLAYLQKVALSENLLETIKPRAFRNLTNLHSVTLDGNNLSNLSVHCFTEILPKLGSLELHNNPWKCDCHLKKFRDWTIERKLYTKPTTCQAPASLAGKMWDEIDTDAFACKPKIVSIGPALRTEIDSGDVTFWCRATGIPRPQLSWVYRSKSLNNLTRRQNGEKGYLLTSNNEWLNLTIPDVSLSDKGDYVCVATSQGGQAEKNISLAVIGNTMGGKDGLISLPLALGLGVTTLLSILITMTLCLCCCRRRRTNHDEKSVEAASMEHHGLGEQEKSLITAINPVVKPPRRYEAPSVTSHGTEMTELNRTLLDNESVFADGINGGSSVIVGGGGVDGGRGGGEGGDDDREERVSPELDGSLIGTLTRGSTASTTGVVGYRQYPPDLLAFSGGRGASPTSQASTAPDNTRLPIQHPTTTSFSYNSPSGQYPAAFKTLPRSVTPYSGLTPTSSYLAPVLPRHGYVTIPRRPRAPSWSSGPPPTSPTSTSSDYLEPVYDNLGKRTTADGSSKESGLSLNKSPEPVSSMRSRPLPGTPTSLYGTIQRSTPNILSSSALDRSAPEGAPEWPSKLNDESMDSVLNHHPQQQVASNTLGRKIPPRPPPKPKKKSANGPLYEDEGEDGTEV